MRTITDYRLGGKPRYMVGHRADLNMRLPDEVQKCVVFLGRQRDKFEFEGTGFLLGVPLPGINGVGTIFLVTAKHVADRLEPDFDIRFNTEDGPADYVEVGGVRWLTHPTDESVDISLLPWTPPSSADHMVVPYHMLLDPDRIVEKGIGVGDEVYVTGLFSPVIGLTRNTPIVRSGHLAMCPPQDVPISDWRTPTMSAHLIEMRSLGGLSGSPVFVQRSIEVQAVEESGRTPLAAGAIFLLGIMHGHWNVRHMDIDYVSPRKNDKKEDLLNVGIAIVLPAEKISEILARPEAQDMLRAAADKIFARYPSYMAARQFRRKIR